MWRDLLRWAHRYVGLAVALFLVLAALTGSLLAFMPELERLSAPHLYGGSTELQASVAEYAAAAERYDERLSVTGVSFAQAGRVVVSVAPKLNPQSAKAYELGFRQIILDPSNTSVLGVRNPGVLAEGWHNLMPFIYELHYSLLLGDTGWWFMGIVAFLWTLDSFTGLLLTLPRQRKEPSGDSRFWKVWGKAWTIKTSASRARLNFDLHRALSLWLWFVLLVFAWSSVYMNLWGSAYLHITRQVLEFNPPWYHLAGRERGPRLAPMSWEDAQASAEAAIEELAVRESLTLIRPNALDYTPGYNAYRFRVQTDRDLSAQHVRTEVYIDASTGEPIFSYLPTGQYAGNTVSSWLHTLHRARIWGPAYQIFVALLGIAIAVISLSGVAIWWQKRPTRRASNPKKMSLRSK